MSLPEDKNVYNIVSVWTKKYKLSREGCGNEFARKSKKTP